jgi:predicted RecB family nuclease
MLRFATREEEVDRLLRGEVFIDLHSIAKQSVRASVEQYSLKELERFCDYARRVPLPEANQARHFIEHQLELSPSPNLADEACRVVEGYNEDDCRTTERLRHWLEKLRALV